MKNKIYQINKYFRGGHTTFYAYLHENRKMKRNYWDYQLGDWADNTCGGHNYGYRIEAKKVSKRPDRAKLRLFFNKYYLEKI